MPKDFREKLGRAAIVTRPLDLGDWAEDYRGLTFDVWVTPTRAHRRAWSDLTDRIREANQIAQSPMPDDADERAERQATLEAAFEEWRESVLRWYAEIWRDTSVEDAREIRDLLQENSPGAWEWLTQRTSEMIREYRDERLKNSKGR